MNPKRKRRAIPANTEPTGGGGSVVAFKTATERAMDNNRSALRRVGVRVIGTEKSLTLKPGATPEPSQVVGEDPFSSLSHNGLTIEPPFDLLTLTTLPEHSSELVQTIEAMETNIDSTGHRFVPRLKLSEATEAKLAAAVRGEAVRLQNFFQYCTTESFAEFRMKLRKDKETTGCCYFEVLRDSTGAICGFSHMPAYQVRLGRMEDDPILVDRKILEMQEADGSVQVKTVKQWRRFRRFVQSRFIASRGLNSTVQGHKVRWYKEFGDPREYSSKTGDVIPSENVDKTPINERANEVIYLRLYSPRTPYGIPRYVGNLLSIFGDRASEEINYTTFRNNNIPSMALLVSNGQLTEGTVERIQSFVESQIQGSDNYSKFLIVEGEPADEDGEDGGHVKIELKPLTNEQHKDALFQNYSKNNQDKIRRAFRLPPIFVGRADDYTRATAEASRRLADEQVFSPERTLWDEVMNRFIFPEMGIVYHKYKSNTPNTTDNEQLVKILGGSEKTGGMTPRIARQILEEVLSAQLPEFPPGFPADVPFSLTMAAAVKNEADPAEPGQQVTALKALTALGILGDQGEDGDDADVFKAAEALLALNKRVEELWRKQASLD